ncbi:MAG: DNA adenine methylase [Caulobacteraceae bacterium]
MIKPPIARMGGKSRLRQFIISLIPNHTCYTEPFFGAGWVFFGKEPSKVEVVNDIDGELINMFRMIKHHSNEVARLMQYEIASRAEFDFYKGINPKYLTEIQRAIRFIYILSQSFASRGVTFGYGTTTRPSPQIFDCSSLDMIKARLRNTYIENLDFEEIFNRYDRPHTLHFCDPPYFETDGYESPFGEKEHIRLRDILSKIKGKFIFTINDHEKVRSWYKGFNIIEVQVTYSVAKKKEARGKYNELIITNFDIDKPKLPLPGKDVNV